jgi:dienelactone hydrolase
MKSILSTLLVLSIFSLNSMAQSLIPLPYQDSSQKFVGLITENSKDNMPAVLILPAWKGIDNEAKQAALDLAKEGYVAMIADIYGIGNVPQDNQAAAKQSGLFKTDYKLYQERIALALNALKKQGVDTNKIAVIGYCFGGFGALETARAGFPVKGVISIHGGLARDTKRKIEPIYTKVLVEHPAADASVSKSDFDNFVAEMNEAQADWQIIQYGNCGHTFTNPEAKDYNYLMAGRAWQHTLLFLSELLK